MNKLIAIVLGLALTATSAFPQPLNRTAPIVVDSKGHQVGTLFGEGLGQLTQMAVTTINGVAIGLPVSETGFVDEATTGSFGYLILWYPSADCAGQGYVALGSGSDPATGKPLNIVPLVQETTDGGGLGTYVYDGILYYAQPPYQQLTGVSYAYFTDPNQPPVGGCQNVPPQDYQAFMGGPVTTFDLSSLNLTPPFKVRP